MAMTSSQPPTNPLKRKMEAPAYPPRRNSSQIANGINRNDHSPTKGVFNNAKATSTSSGALSNEATHGRGSSIHDRTGPSGRKSVSPAFVVGKENPSEREIPSSYIYSTSPVPIQGDYKRMKQLPLALILMIVGFVSAISFCLGGLWLGNEAWYIR